MAAIAKLAKRGTAVAPAGGDILMGAYNTVQSRQVCHACGNLVELTIQFKYGEVWQYKYHIGDQLKWGRYSIGQPGHRRVVVDAVAENCPVCGADGEDYEVWVEDDKIVAVRPASGEYDFVTQQETFMILDP